MTQEQAETLAKGLPSGWMSRVRHILAKRGLHYDDPYLSRVKRGRYHNDAVVEALLQVAREEAESRKELNDRIRAAINQH